VIVELYTREGPSIEHNMHLTSWTQSCSVAIVGNGSFARTSLPDDCFGGIAIPRGGVLGFYITLMSKDLRYTDEDIKEVGEIYQENADIELAVGTGIGSYPLDIYAARYPQRIFNGILKYSSNSNSNAAVSTQLQTTLVGGNGSYGNIFTMEAKESRVKVLSIDILTNISGLYIEVEVWTRPGTYEDHTESMDGWEMIALVSVIGQGEGKVTVIPQDEFEPVEISPTQTQSFYVFLKDSDLVYSGNGEGTDVKKAVKSDDALIIYEGLGVRNYPLSNRVHTYYPRVFNGNINYAITV